MITEVFYFFLLIACIQSSPPDTQLFRPFLLNQNGQPYISNKNTINRNKNDFEPKIIGGIPASSGNTKYQVSIRLRAAEGIFGNGHLCGGSLISYKTVLTAAHCLFYFNDDNKEGVLRSAAEFVLVMGTMNRFIKTPTTLSFRITRFMYHAHFDTTNMIDDIALMFLDGEVPVNYPTVNPIAITTYQVQDGAVCQINGWGTTTFEGSPTNILLTSNVTILSRKECAQSYGDTLLSGMMCAGDWTGAHDACQGDSGGPLAYQNTLVGIVSWGNRCGSPRWPGIYTNVFDFRNWIDTNRGNNLISYHRNLVLFISLFTFEFVRRKLLKF